MPKQRKKDQKSEQPHVVLDVGDLRVEADPDTIAAMVSALIHIPTYRKRFEANPVAHLKEVGIIVPANMRKQITPESIRATLDDLTEGGEQKTSALFPGVAVVVRVGTRPATRPGVNIGVNVAVGTSTFARPIDIISEQPEQPVQGLAKRQRSQAIKRKKSV